MKVIVSGGTGYIGGEVLTQCLNHPSITNVIILTRREPDRDLAQNPKAKVVIVKDFSSYDEATTNELRTADAALWCLGTSTDDVKINIDYPLAFINAIKSESSRSKPFRYIQLGGAFAEPPPKEGEQERSLWYYAAARHVRGRTEAVVMKHDSPQEGFTVNIVKPGAVLPTTGFLSALYYLIPGESVCVSIKDLGATMVDLAVNGSEQKVFLNQEIIKYGRTLSEKST